MRSMIASFLCHSQCGLAPPPVVGSDKAFASRMERRLEKRERELLLCVMDGSVYFCIFRSWCYTCFSPSKKPSSTKSCVTIPATPSSQIAETPQNPKLPIGVTISPNSLRPSSRHSYGSFARSSSTLVTLSWYGWCLSVLYPVSFPLHHLVRKGVYSPRADTHVGLDPGSARLVD